MSDIGPVRPVTPQLTFSINFAKLLIAKANPSSGEKKEHLTQISSLLERINKEGATEDSIKSIKYHLYQINLKDETDNELGTIITKVSLICDELFPPLSPDEKTP